MCVILFRLWHKPKDKNLLKWILNCRFFKFDVNNIKMLNNKTIRRLFSLLLLVCIGASNASEPEFQCFVPGECIFSQNIDILAAKEEIQCLEMCQNNVNCTWFTFYPETDICQLFVSCGSIDDTYCPLCTTGQKECSIPEPVCWVEGLCLGNVTHTEEKIRYSGQACT